MNDKFSARDFRDKYGVEIYTFRYATDRAGIQPSCRVGPVKLYSIEQLPMILSALRRFTRLPVDMLMQADLPSPVAM